MKGLTVVTAWPYSSAEVRMGLHAKITADQFPKQGMVLNAKTSVCFHHDTSRTTQGTIVRDDIEEPWLTIIRLDDGRHVLGTECQYSPQVPTEPAASDS